MRLRIPRACGTGVPQFVRFVLVGIINTAFSYVIYAGLVYLGLAYASANLIALMIGILLSFKTQGILVFNHSANRRLIRFVIVWAGIYLVNIFTIGRFIALGFNPYLSGALALPVATLLSYIGQKYFVFRLSAEERARRATR